MDIVLHLADAAPTATAVGVVVMMALALLLRRPAVSTVAIATMTLNVARVVARLWIQNVAVHVRIAILANIAAVTTYAHRSVANAALVAAFVTQEPEFANEGSGSSGSSNGASESTGGEEASPPELPSSTSIPETTVPSSNPADSTSPTPPTIPSLPDIGGQAADETSITSFTFATITAQSTVGTVLRTFTSTITVYYYTVFITTTTLIRSESSFLSTDFTSAEQEVTAVAADSEAAEAIYRSLRRSLNNEPTLTVSGDGVADFSQTRDLSETTAAGSRFTAAEGDGGVSSAAAGRRWEWGMWIWGFVTIAVGVGMIML
ncbi:MAG: hypothetical protein Q9180_006362 [Flavoplaca navasiana]